MELVGPLWTTMATSPSNVSVLVGRTIVFVTFAMLVARLWIWRNRAGVMLVVKLVFGWDSINVVVIGAACQKLVGLTTSPLVLTETRLVPALLLVKADQPRPRLVRVTEALVELSNVIGVLISSSAASIIKLSSSSSIDALVVVDCKKPAVILLNVTSFVAPNSIAVRKFVTLVFVSQVAPSPKLVLLAAALAVALVPEK